MDLGIFLKQKIRLIIEGTYSIIRFFLVFSSLSIAIIIAFVLVCTLPLKKLILKTDVLYPLLTVILYSTGYILISFIEERYLWINYILLLLMGGYLLNRLFQNEFFNKIRKNIALAFFAFTFALMPLKNLTQHVHLDREIYLLSKEIESYGIKGNLASNNNWHKMLLLSYHLESRYYGLPKKNISPEELEKELKRNEIDYYFVWDEPCRIPQFLSNYKEKTKGKIPELKIYSLKEY